MTLKGTGEPTTVRPKDVVSNMVTFSKESTVSQRQGIYLFCTGLLIAAVLLHKVSVPGLRALPLMAAVLPITAVTALLIGILRIDVPALIAYFVFITLVGVSACLAISPNISLASWALAMVILFPFTLMSGERDAGVRDRVLSSINRFLLVIAVLGIMQFALQGSINRTILFLVDYHLPTSMLLTGYNNLNPLSYGSHWMKSNGVFLAEPSYFSQVIALGIIIEFYYRRRPWILTVYVAAMICSFSGTGILLVSFWAIHYAYQKNCLTIVLAALLAGVAGLWLFGPSIGLDVLAIRITEFTDKNSSGFARFLSIFYVLNDIVLPDPLAVFFGRGPGTLTEYFWRFSFEAFGPTWGKLSYEYGLLGFLAFTVFYGVALIRKGGHFVVPVSILYFFLGSYLLDSSIVALLLSLVVWLPSEEEATGDVQQQNLRNPLSST